MGGTAPGRETLLGVGTEVDLTKKTLVIGNLARWNAEGRPTVSSEHVHFSELFALTKSVLDHLAPSVVLSPLVGDDFDVMDVARRLAEFDYAGRYRAIAEHLPNTEMILREVFAHAPDLDFDILVIPPIANDG